MKGKAMQCLKQGIWILFLWHAPFFDWIVVVVLIVAAERYETYRYRATLTADRKH